MEKVNCFLTYCNNSWSIVNVFPLCKLCRYFLISLVNVESGELAGADARNTGKKWLNFLLDTEESALAMVGP